jgi:uncharacterized protein
LVLGHLGLNYMISLQQIETDLVAAMKAKEQLAVETLRGLKTRIQNEKVAKMSRGAGSASGGNDLGESEIIALIRSEVKRRREAAESFKSGNRAELMEKELKEAMILEKYLPAQMSEADLYSLIEKTVAENSYTAKDFGPAMGKLKVQVGDKADGALLAKLLKEKLK